MRTSAAPGKASRPVVMTAKRHARSHCTRAPSAKAARIGNGRAWVPRRRSAVRTSGVSSTQRHDKRGTVRAAANRADRRAASCACAADVLRHQLARLDRPLRTAEDQLCQHAEQDQLHADDHRHHPEQQQGPAADAGAGEELQAVR